MKFKYGDRVVVSKDSADFDAFECCVYYVNNPNSMPEPSVACTKKLDDFPANHPWAATVPFSTPVEFFFENELEIYEESKHGPINLVNGTEKVLEWH